MSDVAHRTPGRGQRIAPVWPASFLVVLGLHAAATWVVLRSTLAPEVLITPPETVMLDLAPEPAPAPAPEPPPAPPPPEPIPAPPAPSPVVEPPPPQPPPPEPPPPEPPPPEPPPEPPPVAVEPPPPVPLEIVPTPPVPTPEFVLPEPPPPPPRPVPRPRPVAPKPAPRPAPTPVTAQPTAAPAPAPAEPRPPSNSAAIPDWRSALIGKLQRAKRYPDSARYRGVQGTATVSFTIDRTGHVLAATLVTSSGSSLLDEEAVAMIHRADPLPAPPPEVGGATITLPLPVNFSLR